MYGNDYPGFATLVTVPKPIALFDLDNTMYEGFSYFDLIAEQIGEGLIAQGVLDKAQASIQKYLTKQQDYETTVAELLDIYAAGLQGVSYSAVLHSAKKFYTGSGKFFPYVRPTIQKLLRTHEVALVTGEPQFIAEAVSELFDIPSYYSTHFAFQKEKGTGTIVSYMAFRHEKRQAIQHLIQGHGAKHSFAFGDSEGDIEMLRAVEHSICLNPTDGLRAAATEAGWHMPKGPEVLALVNKLVQRAATSG